MNELSGFGLKETGEKKLEYDMIFSLNMRKSSDSSGDREIINSPSEFIKGVISKMLSGGYQLLADRVYESEEYVIFHFEFKQVGEVDTEVWIKDLEGQTWRQMSNQGLRSGLGWSGVEV